MHRLLIVYELQCVAIYSANKHEFIRHIDQKSALKASWIMPKGDSFIVLMATGFLEVYKAEDKKQ
jgi:hypothetical protein